MQLPKYFQITSHSKVAIIALFVIFSIISFILGAKYQQFQEFNDQLKSKTINKQTDMTPVPKVKVDITPTPKIQSQIELNDLENYPKSYLSPEKNLFFYFDPRLSDEKDQCEYAVIKADSKGYSWVVYKGTTKIHCREDMGDIYYSDSFRGWANLYEFLLETTPGKIEIIALPGGIIIDTFSYDPSKSRFIAVNMNMDVWLLRIDNGDTEKSSYLLMGREGDMIKDNLDFNYSSSGVIRHVIYDRVNNGFLFVATKQTEPLSEEKQTQIFYFLSAGPPFKLETIYTTRPVEVEGRGCPPGEDELNSIQGEIRVRLFCETVNKEEYSADGFIRIPLK